MQLGKDAGHRWVDGGKPVPGFLNSCAGDHVALRDVGRTQLRRKERLFTIGELSLAPGGRVPRLACSVRPDTSLLAQASTTWTPDLADRVYSVTEG